MPCHRSLTHVSRDFLCLPTARFSTLQARADVGCAASLFYFHSNICVHLLSFCPPLIPAILVWVPEENVDVIVADGAVEALVPHLSAPEVAEGEEPVACEHEVEKDAALAIGLLAVKVQPTGPATPQRRGGVVPAGRSGFTLLWS